MTSSPRIAVIGSANMDLTTFTDVFPRPGETLFGRNFEMGFGGKGANQAVASRLCGAQVLMVAKVGDDLFGRATMENFASFGIDTTHVQAAQGAPTGVAPIFVEPNGQNRIIVVKGANDRLSPADVDAAAADLRNVDAIILQFEIPLETTCHAIRFARAHDIRCILNPAPAIPAEPAELSGADLLIPNESETEQLTGRPVRSEADAAASAAILLGKGFRRVVITLGAHGSLVADAAGHRHVPAFPVTCVDTSGAGDAFIGSLAVFLAEGLDEREALSRSNLYAALSTTRIGTQKSFPRRVDFETEWMRRKNEQPGSRSQVA
ncbi:MAG TPA: ribokinase [Steroidobacteraceae bacterium]|nr:ribokinase [Steroidobacteraceae bacterium]